MVFGLLLEAGERAGDEWSDAPTKNAGSDRMQKEPSTARIVDILARTPAISFANAAASGPTRGSRQSRETHEEPRIRALRLTIFAAAFFADIRRLRSSGLGGW
jgi:hypothetical protein